MMPLMVSLLCCTFVFGWKTSVSFGWAATKTDNQDMNSWDWAGTFVCHEIYQRPDGTLGVKLPDSMLSAYEPDTEVMKGLLHLKQ